MDKDKITQKDIDSDLVRRSIANSDSFGLIISKYQEPLKRYVRRIANPGKDDLDILLQDIFIKAYENLNEFNQDLAFSSWIYRIAHNESIDYLRKRKNFGGSLDDKSSDNDDSFALVETISTDEDIAVEIDKEYLKKNIGLLLNQIDPKYRAVLILKFLEDRDYNEISDIIRKPPGTVATLIHRAKKEFIRVANETGLRSKI